jgi:hypothetical protein
MVLQAIFATMFLLQMEVAKMMMMMMMMSVVYT